MADLLIRIKKGRDGTAALSCTRADGSVTWQKQKGAQARFFPRHDLTHYSVETVLGFRRAFYGLIAEGWDISGFGPPYPHGPLPIEALAAELLVGFLDVERGGQHRYSAVDFNEKAAAYFSEHGLPGQFALDEETLARIRSVRASMFERWEAVAEGEALELDFVRE
jgi:hypothetical protein